MSCNPYGDPGRSDQRLTRRDIRTLIRPVFASDRNGSVLPVLPVQQTFAATLIDGGCADLPDLGVKVLAPSERLFEDLPAVAVLLHTRSSIQARQFRASHQTQVSLSLHRNVCSGRKTI